MNDLKVFLDPFARSHSTWCRGYTAQRHKLWQIGRNSNSHILPACPRYKYCIIFLKNLKLMYKSQISQVKFIGGAQ